MNNWENFPYKLNRSRCRLSNWPQWSRRMCRQGTSHSNHRQENTSGFRCNVCSRSSQMWRVQHYQYRLSSGWNLNKLCMYLDNPHKSWLWSFCTFQQDKYLNMILCRSFHKTRPDIEQQAHISLLRCLHSLQCIHLLYSFIRNVHIQDKEEIHSLNSCPKLSMLHIHRGSPCRSWWLGLQRALGRSFGHTSFDLQRQNKVKDTTKHKF